ncbi:MAG: hypothetical protein KVP17_003568 [Porospora cf. gigantea B]|uniref:uncharacterized protein n=1 Tax=Porospora cf. gigantea B TaxID=2853592 RepID=UPI003571E190|nr:MAG: hypothetical protein KVP17_003568 [Porospora cf. gigantea B]
MCRFLSVFALAAMTAMAVQVQPLHLEGPFDFNDVHSRLRLFDVVSSLAKQTMEAAFITEVEYDGSCVGFHLESDEESEEWNAIGGGGLTCHPATGSSLLPSDGDEPYRVGCSLKSGFRLPPAFNPKLPHVNFCFDVPNRSMAEAAQSISAALAEVKREFGLRVEQLALLSAVWKEANTLSVTWGFVGLTTEKGADVVSRLTELLDDQNSPVRVALGPVVKPTGHEGVERNRTWVVVAVVVATTTVVGSALIKLRSKFLKC